MTMRGWKQGLAALTIGAIGFGLAGVAGSGCATSGLGSGDADGGDGDGGTCTPPQQSCSGSCTDVTKDHANCGSCGKACAASQVCSGGTCAAGCDGGATACSGSCTDTKTNPKNCGTCGKACGAGETCNAGACSIACGDAGTTKCVADGGAPYCANTATDTANCGACGKTCAALQTCVGGACTPDCSGSDGGVQTICAGDGGPAYCALLQTDATNCGVCGKACKVTEKCTAGTCTPTGCSSPTWMASNQSWTQNNLTYASEILNSTYNPTNLLDNNLTTRWVTSSTTNQWVIFNFGASVTLSGIQIVNQANYTANAGGKDTILQTGPGLSGPWTNVTSFQVANQQSSFQNLQLRGRRFAVLARLRDEQLGLPQLHPVHGSGLLRVSLIGMRLHPSVPMPSSLR